MWFIGIDKNNPVHIMENDIMPGSEFMGLEITKTYTIKMRKMKYERIY